MRLTLRGVARAVLNQQVVLHEQKSYYPEAAAIYGNDVDIVVHEEDTQLLSEPIVAPTKQRKFAIIEKDVPETTYPKEYLADLMSMPELTRSIALVGQIHHGKTTLTDMLLAQTHHLDFELTKMVRSVFPFSFLPVLPFC